MGREELLDYVEKLDIACEVNKSERTILQNLYYAIN